MTKQQEIVERIAEAFKIARQEGSLTKWADGKRDARGVVADLDALGVVVKMDRELPDKVYAYKSKCKQCGKCCKESVCLMGFTFLRTDKIPCPALIEDEHGYWCGLIKSPGSFVFPSLKLNPQQIELLKEHLWIISNIGEGCDLENWKIPKTDLAAVEPLIKV